MRRTRLQSDNDNEEAQERVGAVLNDKWTLEGLIGVGGMAAVYAGRHRNGARAAVKVLHRSLARHKEVRERFQREGYAANKVGHPNVVKVLDDDVIATGPDSGTPYLVMELFEGESLQDRLERGPPVGEREFLDIVYQVLSVLQAAEKAGVVHRDLKPENLFFARDATQTNKVRVKVLDFGLARLLAGQSITTHGLALGTPSFMSPEQAAGRLNEIDARTDLFALAATGFRLRTGRRIHEADDPVELVMKMARLPAPKIQTIVPDVSPPFARVIDRALEFKRDDRYESATAMREDVARAIKELDAGARSARPPPPPPRAAARTKPAREEPQRDRGDVAPRRNGREHAPRPAYGLDESVRIPKNASLLPWLAVLLLLGGVGVAAWRDPTDASRLLGEVRAWGKSLLGPGTPTTDAGAPASDVSARSIFDAGMPRPSGSGGRTVTAGSATAVRRSSPAQRDQ
jgi:serine/threonine-protein kinase